LPKWTLTWTFFISSFKKENSFRFNQAILLDD
jgi:hypothetical protein